MRGILLLLPVALLSSGCESRPGPTAPFSLPVVSSSPVRVSGTVYDATDEATGTRTPLSGVRVTLHVWNEDVLVEESVFAETMTDQEGRYSLGFNARDTIWLGARKDGYQDYAHRVGSGSGPELDIELVRR